MQLLWYLFFCCLLQMCITIQNNLFFIDLNIQQNNLVFPQNVFLLFHDKTFLEAILINWPTIRQQT